MIIRALNTRAVPFLIALWGICLGCAPGTTLGLSPSHADNVCEDVADCSQGGDNDWLKRCVAEASILEQQATTSACSDSYNAYYSCADGHFECNGITATFSGCETQLGQLETCLNAATAQSACAAYAAQTENCPGGPGNSPPGSPIVPPCTVNLQCQAQCYLSSVSNVCLPGIPELGVFSQCVQSCPP